VSESSEVRVESRGGVAAAGGRGPKLEGARRFDVRGDLEHCDIVARRAGKNFYWGFRFLETEQRLAMSALYAFARATDDIVDEGDLSRDEREKAIKRWRSAFLAAAEDGDGDDPILRAIGRTIDRYGLPVHELLALVDACRRDLYKSRYETMHETLDYCRKVAGTVGLNMLSIFRVEHVEAERAMLELASAFQLTNILRDVPEDARRDRIYLPLAGLRDAGVSEREVLEGGSASLRAYMRVIAEQAREHYRRSERLGALVPPRADRTLRVMRGIYEGILDQILSRDCDVWSRRPSLSFVAKCRVLLPPLAQQRWSDLWAS